jgi:molecular chaperone GrpE
MEINSSRSANLLTRLGRKQRYRLRRRRYLGLDERLPESHLHALDENQRLLSLLRDLQTKHVHLVADFENFRKRSLRERQKLILTASEDLVHELLPVIDNFERALSVFHTTTDLHVLSSGIEMIYKSLLSVLRTAGLQPIETENASFDPHFHEAISTEEQQSAPDNRITQELLRGYTFRGRVLRPALVKVNKIRTAAPRKIDAQTDTSDSNADEPQSPEPGIQESPDTPEAH